MFLSPENAKFRGNGVSILNCLSSDLLFPSNVPKKSRKKLTAAFQNLDTKQLSMKKSPLQFHISLDHFFNFKKFIRIVV